LANDTITFRVLYRLRADGICSQDGHSVATWAIESGVDLPAMSTFLGHRTIATTKRFYATHATPRNPLIIVPPPAPKKKKRARKARRSA